MTSALDELPASAPGLKTFPVASRQSPCRLRRIYRQQDGAIDPTNVPTASLSVFRDGGMHAPPCCMSTGESKIEDC
jgi:hypothetical protein